MTGGRLETFMISVVAAFGGGAIAIGLDATLSAQSSRELSGDRLTLTDARGTVRVGLGLSGGRQEYTYLYLNDRNGQQQVSFMVSPDRPPTIQLRDHSGREVRTRLLGQPAGSRREGQAAADAGARDHRQGAQSRPTTREQSAAPERPTIQDHREPPQVRDHRAPRRECGQTPTFADLRDRLPGRQTESAGEQGRPDDLDEGKTDSVALLQLPPNPRAADVRNWLSAHNSALLASIRGRFSTADVNAFRRVERDACSGNLYCEMAFRQEAIALLLQ
jgi:hypothetical protein